MINAFLYFLLFIKASLFSTGGFGNLPSLHQDLLSNGWAVEADFGESIVIGQISPGPNGLWVISLGYLTYGYLGAILALVAITLPPLLVLGIAAIYGRIARQRWVEGLMRGISLAVVAITCSVCWTIIRQPGVDWTGWIIAAVAFALAMTHRVNIMVILALAGCAGAVLYR
jgi:chromate transporter